MTMALLLLFSLGGGEGRRLSDVLFLDIESSLVMAHLTIPIDYFYSLNFNCTVNKNNNNVCSKWSVVAMVAE